MSNFECSFASVFDVDANSVMEKLCSGRRGSVAKTCSAVPGSRHPSVVADRAGLVTTSFLENRSNRVHALTGTPSPRANRWASMDGCDKKRGGCGAIMNYFHSAASIADKEAKAKMVGKKREVATISQRAAQIVEGVYTKESEDVACPRCDRELHVFNTASGPILRCRGWSLAGMYVDQSVPRRSRRSWRVEEYQPYRRRRFSEWFWCPRNTPKTKRWHTGSTSYKRLGGPGASSSSRPIFGTGTVCSVATSPSTVSASSISSAARGGVDDGSLASASRGRRIHWRTVEHGHGNGSDWCVTAQSNTTPESESLNHRQDCCGNAWSNDTMKDEPMLTASHVLEEHPCEIRQEDEVPELAAAIRECGIWARHRSLAVFWSPTKARDKSREFNVLSRDTFCLESHKASEVG